jgi:hypothetical protein
MYTLPEPVKLSRKGVSLRGKGRNRLDVDWTWTGIRVSFESFEKSCMFSVVGFLRFGFFRLKEIFTGINCPDSQGVDFTGGKKQTPEGFGHSWKEVLGEIEHRVFEEGNFTKWERLLINWALRKARLMFN